MKKFMFVVTMMCLLTLWLLGCNPSKKTQDAVDYSAYPFVDVSWTREAEHDLETICFDRDGSFHYSCACGNPVNDADLCEGYTYDDETKIITLDYLESTEDAVTEIKILSCDEQQLQLDFDGEIRIFTK